MTPEDLLLPYQSEEFMEAWEGWVDMRKGEGFPLKTDRQRLLAIRELKKYSDSEAEAIAMLDQSTLNSWRGLFPLRQSTCSVRPDKEWL
jgi:hypothetical protein